MWASKVSGGPTAKDGARSDKFENTRRTVDRLVHKKASAGYQTSFDSRQHFAAAFSDLSFGQTSVALLVAAGLGAVTADVGAPGAVLLTGLLANYLWPLQAASLLEVGKSAAKVVLGYATALMWSKARTQTKVHTSSSPVNAAPVTYKMPTAAERKTAPVSIATFASPKVSTSIEATTKPASWTAQPQQSGTQETPLKAPAAVLTPPASWRRKVIVSPPTSSMMMSLTATNSSHPLVTSPLARPRVKTPRALSVSSELALAQPVGFRPMSIATVGLHMAHADTPRPLNPCSKELKPAGLAGVMVSNPSAGTYARKLAQQKEWEMAVCKGVSVAGSSGSSLPRVRVSSMAELLSTEWHEVVVFAATPMEWGAQGSKQVTWGDLKLVAAYGISA